jgi:hypothetical protein
MEQAIDTIVLGAGICAAIVWVASLPVTLWASAIHLIATVPTVRAVNHRYHAWRRVAPQPADSARTRDEAKEREAEAVMRAHP